MPINVIHLVDDVTAGGVMNVVKHVQNCPEMAKIGNHQVAHLKRGALNARPIHADVIVSHLSISWRTLPALIALRALNATTPLLHVEHSYTEAFTNMHVKNKNRFYTLLSTAFALFDQVISVSKAQGQWLINAELVHPENHTTICSTVDYAKFRALPPASEYPCHFGAIGRLEPQKGFDILIDSFKRVEGNITLHIYGTGTQEACLKQLAADDRRIIFHGHHEDMQTVMSNIDALLMPSRWEAYGLVAAEALEAGRRVLVNPVDGLQDHISNGAIAVEHLDPNCWAKAIEAQSQRAHITTLPARSISREAQFAQSWNNLLQACLIEDTSLTVAC